MTANFAWPLDDPVDHLPPTDDAPGWEDERW